MSVPFVIEPWPEADEASANEFDRIVGPPNVPLITIFISWSIYPVKERFTHFPKGVSVN